VRRWSGRGLTRRDFVQRIGGAALALPLLEVLEGEPLAQTPSTRRSKYMIFLYTNDGVHNGNFWPTNGDPTSSPTLSSLAPYKSKVLVLGPMLTGSAPARDTGLTYNTRPAQHRAAICLTASKVGLPLNDDQFHAVNKVDGPSIDWVIAEALRKADGPNATPFPFLNFGIHPIGGDTPSDINYDSSGNPLQRMASAKEVSDVLFGGMVGTGGGTGDADAAAELRKQTAVTDFLAARFSALAGELGAHDRQVVDQHLTSLRAFEERRQKLLTMRSNPGAACGLPAAAAKVPIDDTSVRTGADTELLAPFFMQSIATALNCGMTRVASLSFGYPGGGGAGGLRMPWLGFSDAQHSVSHHGGAADKLRKYGLMNAWTITQVKYLLDQLAAAPTPTGTLLDDTTIYLFNRHGDGNGHTNFALPNVILGGTGGYFKTGQVLSLPKTSPTRVLISLANAAGVDVKSFGSGAYADTAALAGIAT
jgi:hypothetical protein